MSDGHSVSVCHARVAELYFKSVSVLVGTTALHTSKNVGQKSKLCDFFKR